MFLPSLLCFSAFICLSFATLLGGSLPTPSTTQLVSRNLEGREDKKGILPDVVVDLAQVFAERELLLQTSDDLAVTCVGCSLSGKFKIRLVPDVDQKLLDDIKSAVGKATGVVTSVAGGIIKDIESAIPAKASEIANNVKDAIDDILPFRKRENESKGDIPSLLSQLASKLSVTVEQIEPMKADFSLEYSSGNTAITFQFPDPTQPLSFVSPRLGPINGLPSIQLGPLSIGFRVLPIGFTTGISLAPGVNATFPFGADFALQKQLLINHNGVQNPESSFSTHFDAPILNKFDPSLCFTAAVGPSILLEILEPISKSEVKVGANVEIPRATFCLSKKSDVDNECKSPGEIKNAIEVKADVNIALSPVAKIQVAGKNVLGIPDIPSLAANFPILDRCFNIGDGKTVVDNPASSAMPLPVYNFTTSVSAGTLTSTMLSTVSIASDTVASQPKSTHAEMTMSTGSPSMQMNRYKSDDKSKQDTVYSIQASAQPQKSPTATSASTTSTSANMKMDSSASPNSPPPQGAPQTVTVTAAPLTVTATVTETVSVQGGNGNAGACSTASTASPSYICSSKNGTNCGNMVDWNSQRTDKGDALAFDEPIGVVFVIPVNESLVLSMDSSGKGGIIATVSIDPAPLSIAPQ